jgi:hypothetical protein
MRGCVTNILFENLSGKPLWSSGQSSWVQIQRSGTVSRRYQISKYWVWNGVHSAS